MPVSIDRRANRSVWTSKNGALKTGRHAVHLAQTLRLADQIFDPLVGGAGYTQVGLCPRADARARGVGLQERRRESLERVMPSRGYLGWRRPAG